jgi:hypothetical protein
MLTKAQAIAKAIAHGATSAEIEDEAARQSRNVGSVPFNNMIRALNLMPWRNDRADWTRLAAALIARGLARKR